VAWRYSQCLEPVGMSKQSRAYLAMHWEEEMEHLEQRCAKKKTMATHEAKESIRQVRKNALEVEWTLRNRVLSPLLSLSTLQLAATSSEASVRYNSVSFYAQIVEFLVLTILVEMSQCPSLKDFFS
jgi:hypothetical protein